MTRVVIIPQFVGVVGAVELQKDLIPKYAKPAEARVLHEPVTISDFDMVNNLNTKKHPPEIVYERLQLEMRWGPSAPYLELYRFLQSEGYQLHPLDHSVFDRRNLANGFRRVAKSIKEHGATEALRKEYRMLKRRLYNDREKLFDEVIDTCRDEGVGTTFVLVHPRHMPGIRNKLERDMYEYEFVQLGEGMMKGMRVVEEALLNKAAETVLDKELPPLMPAFYLASRLAHSASG